MDSIPSEPGTAASPWRDSREPGQPGPAVGHYVLGRCIGSGGMARVYEARHRFLGHRVAIKLLYPEHCSDPHLVRRFCNEGRAAAAIEHPGLVRYFDVGRTAECDVYLVMELLAGESLHRRLTRAPLPEAAAVAIGRQIASALVAAHAHGLVHRDIKPENVFLVLDPEVPGGERVKVLDFGIAKRTRRADTSPGILVGTPAYMAPEQCQPGMPLDGRADIYALGALLHRMVTGRPVFESANDVALMCRQVHDAPPSPRSLGIPVSDAFERMLATCLAKDPADRFPSMAALADMLAAMATRGSARVKDTELMPAQVVPDVDIEIDVDLGDAFAAAPLYPVCDPSPPGGVMAGGTPPPRMWTQSQPGGMAARRRRWSLLARWRAWRLRRRARPQHVQPRAVTSVRARSRPSMVLGGLTLVVVMIALAALSW
ncbi:MAG TPA: serine/threonine-protein kinase [Haliangium sp.]|nr:serine/threonine-protein kinase [Haliangium sp.]